MVSFNCAISAAAAVYKKKEVSGIQENSFTLASYLLFPNLLHQELLLLNPLFEHAL